MAHLTCKGLRKLARILVAAAAPDTCAIGLQHDICTDDWEVAVFWENMTEPQLDALICATEDNDAELFAIGGALYFDVKVLNEGVNG